MKDENQRLIKEKQEEEQRRILAELESLKKEKKEEEERRIRSETLRRDEEKRHRAQVEQLEKEKMEEARLRKESEDLQRSIFLQDDSSKTEKVEKAENDGISIDKSETQLRHNETADTQQGMLNLF